MPHSSAAVTVKGSSAVRMSLKQDLRDKIHRRRVQTFSSESFSDSGFDAFLKYFMSVKFALISKAASLYLGTTAFEDSLIGHVAT